MDLLWGVLGWVSLLVGGALVIIAGVGILRLPDVYARMHAAGITDTLGAGLVLFGLMVEAGFTQVTIKLVLILVFLVFTSPAATHAVAKAALLSGLRPFAGGAGARGPEERSS